MAELTGNPGFAPPRKDNALSRRRAATIELAATVGLTVSLIIAATAELHGAEVLHVDGDYEMIAEVTGQPMRRLFDPSGE